MTECQTVCSSVKQIIELYGKMIAVMLCAGAAQVVSKYKLFKKCFFKKQIKIMGFITLIILHEIWI